MISMIDIEHQAIKAKNDLKQLEDFVHYYEPKHDKEKRLKEIDDAETSIARILTLIRKG